MLVNFKYELYKVEHDLTNFMFKNNWTSTNIIKTTQVEIYDFLANLDSPSSMNSQQLGKLQQVSSLQSGKIRRRCCGINKRTNWIKQQRDNTRLGVLYWSRLLKFERKKWQRGHIWEESTGWVLEMIDVLDRHASRGNWLCLNSC